MITSISDKKIHSAIKEYLNSLSNSFATGSATEHTYRPAFQNILQAVLPEAGVVNEPKHIECGAPDFVLNHNNIPRGYIEAKDLNKNLDDENFKEQFSRYSESLGNLIFTNYLEFRLVRDGELISTMNLGTVTKGEVKPVPQHFNDFVELLNTFWGYQGQTIKSANTLAKHMAAKARMLAGVIVKALEQDEEALELDNDSSGSGNELQSQLEAFKARLISDLEPGAFADIYAQTIAYGLFCARLHDETLETFTRHEAAGLIPKSNPFLYKFFNYIADFELDSRIRWIIDDLADLFSAADVGELMQDYGKATHLNDPFLYFYETFLGEYDYDLRKSRGVYYTPEPVVNFIVRAVDEILQTIFGLSQGLADTSKTVIEFDAPTTTSLPEQGKNKKHRQEAHKVQILDPATGTGTFLSNIVQHIYQKRFANQKGIWPDYVLSDLIPRLNGFEILMASYAMAHTKLEMVLRDSGCDLGDQRLRIFLTNSLEEYRDDHGPMLAKWLADEAKVADSIKRDTPVMVVIGNPPYRSISHNKGKWITNLIEQYKYVNGEYFEEKKHSLDDDYVKFIRYGQHHIDRSGVGVLAYINNHSFLDNPTSRGMRWSLLQSFDNIYIIDLHGNSRKKEVSPDGSPDNNVFDIQQGVSINLFVKTGKKKKNELAQLLHYDLYGTREGKYQFLCDKNLPQIDFKEIYPQAPQYYFVPKNFNFQTEYNQGVSITDLFSIKSVGIITARDDFTIYHTSQELKAAIADFRRLDDITARERFSLRNDTEEWKVALARQDLEDNVFSISDFEPVPISYRPFDTRYTYYTGKSKGFHSRPLDKVMQHFLMGENVGLITSRMTKDAFSALCTKYITSHKCATVYDKSYVFPLYLQPDPKQLIDTRRIPNLNYKIVNSIAEGLGLNFTPEKQEYNDSFSPIDILDYIYAILHSPTYRERYNEFLKTDFPKVPYPTDKELFWKLVKLGGELRSIHLMESPDLGQLVTHYNIPGSNVVKEHEYKIESQNDLTGNVYINKTQYFGGVPKSAWEFYIGGHQPARKWLKDRTGRKLAPDDVKHYQKIIVALMKTADIMSEINNLPITN